MKALKDLNHTIQLIIARSFFLPSMANNLNGFCDTRTLCSTYYTRELSHLTSGEVLALEPVAAQNTYHGKAEECGEKGRFSLTKPKFRKNTGTLLLRV